MGIRSIFTAYFTSHEKLFAEWMMQHEFNQEIQAEPRFPGCDQYEVTKGYYTTPDKPSPVRYPSKEEKIKIGEYYSKEAILKRQEAGSQVKPTLESDESSSEYHEAIPMKTRAFKIVHGPMVQAVEKKSSAIFEKYGDFWGMTRFAVAEKHTGYFLVDGWLVVSIPEVEKDNPFEVNDDIDITVALKYDEGPDPVASKISAYMLSWFAFQGAKVLIVFTISLVGAVIFVMTGFALGNSSHLVGQLTSRAFLIGSIAMQAMVFYSGIKLYRLLYFTNKMSSIKNLGDWVLQIRHSAKAYPDQIIESFDRSGQFFTESERETIIMSSPAFQNNLSKFMQKNADLLSKLNPMKV
jgi:hypothetical protein